MLKVLSKVFGIWYVAMILVFMYAMFTDKRFRPFMWIWIILFGLYLYYDYFIYQENLYIRE